MAIVAGVLFFCLVVSKKPPKRVSGEMVEGLTSTLNKKIPIDAGLIQFTDVTAQAGINFIQFSGTRTSQLPEDMGSGVAWGDYDNDGDQDLFIVSSGGSITQPKNELAPSILFDNNGDGTFSKSQNFPALKIFGMGVTWADYNNDGWLDLMITGYQYLGLFKNNKGLFIKDSRFPALIGYWAGAAWADFDNDNDLDLYVCGYVNYIENQSYSSVTRQYGRDVPHTLNPSSYKPTGNLLFRNNGDGTFDEIASKMGVENSAGRSLSALWHDFDQNGWLDLYIANDISDNVLFMNHNGRFKDSSHESWVADYRGAMGLAAGDWNRDGDDDIFVTHWIAQENALYDSTLTEQRKQDKNFKEQPLHFMDMADMTGLGQIALHSVGWATSFDDFDADGYIDLIVTNGSTFETIGHPSLLKPQSLFLFWNDKGTYFHNIAPLIKSFDTPQVGRGLAVSDYDKDGDLDFIVVSHGQGVQLFRNDGIKGSAKQNNWVILSLQSLTGKKNLPHGHGQGAFLVATVEGKKLLRTVGGTSYLSQNSLNVHFGLGDKTSIDMLEVFWLGGDKNTYKNIAANHYYQIKQGSNQVTPSETNHLAHGKLNKKQMLLKFWTIQRKAVDALKIEKNIDLSIGLFKKALLLNPTHEDSIFYLGQLYSIKGEYQQAMTYFKLLVSVNPKSFKGHRQIGLLQGRTANSRDDLINAGNTFKTAFDINSEETGVMLLMGELSLMLGQDTKAKQYLEWVGKGNPRSVGSFFLQGYLFWKIKEAEAAGQYFNRAITAQKKKKIPRGATAEGDVKTKMHRENTLLSQFYTEQNLFTENLEKAYSDLSTFLEKY